MISSKKLAQLSKKWPGMGAIGRRRVAAAAAAAAADKETNQSCSLVVAGKGNFVVYSSDGRRFEIPLACLGTTFFAELLKLSQESGFAAGERRITLPCDAAVMEYVMCLLRREASEDVERALLSSIVVPCHGPSGMVQPASGVNQQISVCSS
ncbi:hypothetical protein ACP4OV_018188 [Aristida adscensionis]